jgi:hypothetical protein
MTTTITQSQADALASGGLDQHCLDHHPVCLHCGACRSCQSGCGCDTPDDAEGCDCGGCVPADGVTRVSTPRKQRRMR